MYSLKDGRVDIRVYNEATLFTLSSESLAGYGFQDIDLANETAWQQAVENGVIMPVEVWQDDSFTARIVLGDLHKEEESQWLGRVTWKLTIPCGRLALWAGVPEDDEYSRNEYAHFIEIPPGDYEVTSYCFTTSPNARFPGDDEPLGTYFRRTRPGEKFPPWLAMMCAQSPEEDPEHETQWERFEGTKQHKLLCDVFQKRRLSYVDFLIQLQCLDSAPSMPQLTRRGFVETELRRPKRCPIGLYARLGAGPREAVEDPKDLFVDVAEVDDSIESDEEDWDDEEGLLGGNFRDQRGVQYGVPPEIGFATGYRHQHFFGVDLSGQLVQAAQSRVDEIAEYLASLGQEPLGALVHVGFGDRVACGYAASGGDSFGLIQVPVVGPVDLEFLTALDDGRFLISTPNRVLPRSAGRVILHIVSWQADMEELRRRHEKRLRGLANQGVAPAPATATLEGFAELMEAFFLARVEALRA